MTSPAVIITRAEPGASETAECVRLFGLDPIVSPALTLELVDPVPDIPLQGAGGLIFTSANGVRFFSRVSNERSLRVFCVGPATLAAAKEAGFRECFNADGNSEDLIELIVREGDPADGQLLHIANTAAAGNVQSKLTAKGFDVRFVGLYRPVPASHLTADARRALLAGRPVCVLIHSAKGASAFADLLADTGRDELTFICVSEKAAEPISKLGRVLVAPRPNEDEVQRTLKDWTRAL